MKKLKLFPKITLYTFFITLFVMLMAHLFLYLLAPQMILSSDQFKENGAFIISSMNMGMLIKAAIIKAFPISLLCCTVISFLCSILFSKAMTSPIRKICQTTKEMEKMDECSQCEIQSNDEIGELANHVNTLYRSLLMSIRKLEEEKEKVSEAEKSKIDFLRVASHELKTPVTALHAMIENMILQIGRYKNRDECLMECKELTEQLANMIQEVLNTSNLDFSHEGQEATHYDLSMEIMNICEPYQLIAKTKHQIFEIHIHEACPVFLPQKSLERILSNLVSNAISYTAKNHRIIIDVYADNIMIQNECTPISNEVIPHLFEPFYRPDFARNRKDGGNGLGLYIVDTLCKALNLSYTFQPITSSFIGMCFTLYLSSYIANEN